MNPATTTTTGRACTLLNETRRVADSVFRDVAEILAEVDLTKSQASLLWALEPSTPRVSMRGLARLLRCDPSNITLLGDQLQAAGLIERHPDPTDGRRRVGAGPHRPRTGGLVSAVGTNAAALTAVHALHQRARPADRTAREVQTNRTQIPTGYLS